MSTPDPHEEGRASAQVQQALVARAKELINAGDVGFGSYCVLMIVLATVGYLRHRLSVWAIVASVAYLAANIIMSHVGRRGKDVYRPEVVRAVLGLIVAPAAYVFIDGWWPGFMAMYMASGVLIPITTQKSWWGYAAMVYYIALHVLSTLLFVPVPDWHQVLVGSGMMFGLGMLWTKMMVQFGLALRRESERSVELAKARDALFAELEIAQQIQTLLLPREPKLRDSRVSGRMLTATEVGGDYYDGIETAGRRALLAIGDVSGHGVTSGLTMMMARASLVAALEANPTASLAEIYSVLNRCLRMNLERMNVNMYMTFALVEYLGDGHFAAVGRHLPLIIYRKRPAKLEEIELEGMWLGVMDDLDHTSLPESKLDLAPEDLLVMYTDGIVEHSSGQQMFGFERFKDLIREHSDKGASGLIDEVLRAMDGFSKVREDDMTMLVVDHRGDVAASIRN